MANVIRDLVIKVSVDADTKGFAEIDKAQEETSTGSIALGNILADLAGRLIDVGIQAAKAGAAMVTDLVFGQAEAADKIAKTSKQLGVQSDQLQRLSGAASLSGADVATLDKGVRTLTKGLAAANLTGTGPANEALETLGLTVADLAGDIEAGNIEGIVGTIGDAFTETGDSIEKSAALMQLFGGAGTKLRPLLEEGSEGVAALGDEIKNVISPEDLAQFEGLVDAQFLVEDSIESVKNEIAAGLAPAITEIAGDIRGWIDDNQEFIDQDLPVILEGVAEALAVVAEFTFETIGAWRDFIKEIDQASERFAMDFPEAVSVASDALAVVGQVAEDVGDQIERVVNFILDAVGKLDALESTVNSIKAGLGLDDEPTAERGAPGFLGGGANLVAADKLTPDNDSASLERIAGGNFSESDKAIAAASLPIAKQREVSEAAEKSAAANAKALPDQAKRAADRATRASRRADAEARRSRDRRKRGRGGGGGGGRAAAAAPSVDDLITGAIGAATGQGPARAGSSALAGTMLVQVDQSVTITHGPTSVTFEVPPSAVASGSSGELVGAFREMFTELRREERITDFDLAASRQNVGGG